MPRRQVTSNLQVQSTLLTLRQVDNVAGLYAGQRRQYKVSQDKSR
jgi:hypothetical protein